MRTRLPMHTWLPLTLLALAACSKDSGPASPSTPHGAPGDAATLSPQGGTGANAGGHGADAGTDETATVPYATSERPTVLWKRYAALEADLSAALELPPDALCAELGGRSCIRDVHVVALGGNDAFRSGILRPATEPLTTTPLVVDRLLLRACAARVRLDAAGPPVLFSELPLGGPMAGAAEAAIDSTVTTLYRRLLARDPHPEELQALRELAAPDAAGAPPSADEFALAACFAVGGTLEFLFH